jgi:hypothetical protein
MQSNTENQWCSACKPNAFTLSTYHVNGCLACNCMGITDRCSPALFEPLDISTSLFSSQFQPTVTAVDEFDVPLSQLPRVATIDGGRVVEVDVPDNSRVYWRESSLHGNLLKYYGCSIRLTVNWVSTSTLAGNATWLNETRIVLIGRSNTTVQFRVSLVGLRENMTMLLRANLSVENAVTVNGVAGRPTRKTMLLTLTNVRRVLLPASFSIETHLSRFFSQLPSVISVYPGTDTEIWINRTKSNTAGV